MAEANESGSVWLFRAAPQALLWKSLWLRPIPWDMTAIYYMPRIHDIYHGSESELLMNTVDIPGKCFERRVRQEDLWIKQFLRPLTDASLFVAAPYICTLWWLHWQIMATSLSDPNDGNDFICSKWSRTENDDGNSRRFIVGEECPAVWEPPVLNPYGSF